MSEGVVANLNVNIRANTGNLEKAADKASGKVKDLADQTEKEGGRISGAFSRLGGMVHSALSSLPFGDKLASVWDAMTSGIAKAIAKLGVLKGALLGISGVVTAIGAGFIAMGLSSMKGIVDLNKTSEKLGIPVEELAGYAHKSRMEIDDLDHFLTHVAKHMGEAATGNKEAAESFTQLGVNAKDFQNGLTPNAILQLADGFVNLKNQTDRVTVAMKIGGKSGANALKLFKDGRSGIQDAIAESKALGLSVTQAQAQHVAAAAGALKNMKQAFTGLGRTAAIAIAPFVETLANSIKEAIIWLNKYRDNILDTFDQAEFALKHWGATWDVIGSSIKVTLAGWDMAFLKFSNKFISLFSDVLPGVVKAFWDSMAKGFFGAGYKEALKTEIGKVLDNMDAIGEGKGGLLANRIKIAEANLAKFQAEANVADKNFVEKFADFKAAKDKARAINPMGAGGAFTTKQDNAAVERGTQEAFKIIAGDQGDKMWKVANDQLAEIRKHTALLEDIKRKKNQGIGKAAV